MYPSIRRFEIRSIGIWLLPVGRPTEDSKRQWQQRCNFVFKTTASVRMLDDDHGCGWIISIMLQDETEAQCFISNDHAASNTMLRKRIMSVGQGTICRMTSDDFLSFIDKDTANASLPIVYMVRHMGKVKLDEKSYWVYPHIILDEKGKKKQDAPMFVCLDILKRRENGDTFTLPAQIPTPVAFHSRDEMYRKLKQLSNCIRKTYGPRFMQVAHLLTSVLKAIHFDTIMHEQHFVPISNISGPANVGKTLACAIALEMMESKAFMMSRCTPSAMIDVAHVFKNMLIVWDDPRDCSAAQLSSIVHEAFNGLANCTISRGTRQYNSALIIGTQEANLGMCYNAVNCATFSRLSHINMNIGTEWTLESGAETRLQEVMHSLEGVFSYLIQYSWYHPGKVHEIFQELQEQNPSIISRSLQIAAIDCHLCTVLNACGFAIGQDELQDYFFDQYPTLLLSSCARLTALDQFCADVKQALKKHDLSSACFKKRVLVDLKNHGPTECFSVYTKDFFPILEPILGKRKLGYTKEQVHSQLKQSPNYGEVSRNVAYKCEPNVVQIKRSIVIRRCHIE